MTERFWTLRHVAWPSALLPLGVTIAWLGAPVFAQTTATATFTAGTLSVVGTDADDVIVVSAGATTGQLVVTVDGETLPILVVSGTANRATTNFVSVSAGGGNDSIHLLRELNTRNVDGTLLRAPIGSLQGQSGNDTMVSDFGGFVGGVIGNPIVGNVVMDGGGGDDILVSGFGNDAMLGGNGSDTLWHRPGTLSDTFEGGAGRDTARFIGNEGGGDVVLIRRDPAQTGWVRVERTNLVRFVVQTSGVEDIAALTQTGDDTVIITDLAGTAVRQILVDGGGGNDFIAGSSLFGVANVELLLFGGDGDDVFVGGNGSNTLTGGHGVDDFFGGNGRDWIVAKDDQVDHISCGGAADFFSVDTLFDDVPSDCEFAI